MKRIINGKKYDTNTAEIIGEWQNVEDRRDFNFVEEVLYRKRATGEFYLFGQGGPNTKYARSIGNGWWQGSSEIIPFTEKEARKWAEKALDGDRFEEVFGEVAE